MMTEPLRYIISYDELMVLVASRDSNERMTVIVTVTSHPYREKGAGEVMVKGAARVGAGAANLFSGLVHELSKEESPKRKS